ncbi:MAG TPA: carboxypeptidase regulatory-like domain-containing protein, partial [Trebonia sp.]|nr:carboxypeptidase regulatory-like domain-containing protein [Trebonia sp.]
MLRTNVSRACAALALMIGAVSTAAVAQELGARTATRVAAAPTDTTPTADVLGTVTDTSSGGPLASAEIQILRNGQVIAQTHTDRLGAYRIHGVRRGSYVVEARLVGFKPASTPITIGRTDIVNVSFVMVAAPIVTSAIEVTAAPEAVDTRTGDQVFKQDEFQGSPALTTSQIVQQAIAGAARAPTGEVHIRGQHAEYTYYIDGVPVPPGISGSLNELFDPTIADQIDFQTGS